MGRSFEKLNDHRELVFILIFGFVIRLFAYQFTYVINPDGVLYIQQARALYYGEHNLLFSCLRYLSNLPFFIAGAYTIFDNWIIAAQSISLLFGFAILIPLYFLFRRFFDKQISTLGILIFALIPDHVDKSGDALREPVCWFFLILGLYFFIYHIDTKKRLYLFFSSLCYIMATWARIEVILVIIISCIFIITIKQEAKTQKIIIFTMPLVFIGLLSYSGSLIFDIPIEDLHRANEIQQRILSPIYGYTQLRDSLAVLIMEREKSMLGFFLTEARTSILFIALATVLNRILEGFFYPFFIVFAVGLKGIWEKIKKDIRVLYLLLLASSALIMLYIHTVGTWMIYNRFMAIVIFPCFILLGFGLKKIIDFLTSKFSLKQYAAISIICMLILISGLPKNLKSRGFDKTVFAEIGEVVASRENNNKITKIGGAPSTALMLVSFFANLKYPGAPCDRPSKFIGKNYNQFLEILNQNGIRYLLWDERYWPFKDIDLRNKKYIQNLKKLGTWYHHDTGQIILFYVKQ